MKNNSLESKVRHTSPLTKLALFGGAAGIYLSSLACGAKSDSNTNGAVGADIAPTESVAAANYTPTAPDIAPTATSVPPTATTVPPTPVPAATPFPNDPKNIVFPIQNGSNPSYTREAAIDYYVNVAFGESASNPLPFLFKWQKPVRVLVQDAPENFSYINAYVDEIRNLTGLDISLVDQIGKENVSVRYGTQEALPSKVKGSLGYFEMKLEAGLRGPLGYCDIGVDRDATFSINNKQISIQSTFLEELVSCMGFGDSKNTSDNSSIFCGPCSNSDKIITLAPIDKFLLVTHYSPMLKPGMSKTQVRDALNVLYPPASAKTQ